MQVFVAYRDNGLYREFVPRLLEGLEVHSQFVVPQGTEFAEVEEAAIAAADKARKEGATFLLCDNTCFDLYYRKNPALRSWEWNKRFSQVSCLDWIFFEELRRQCPQNTVADNLAWLARLMTAGKQVSSIVIVEDNLHDHGFVGLDAGELSSKWDREDNIIGKWLAQQLHSVFPDAGITTVETLQEALDLSAKDPEALIVADRHCGIKEQFLDGVGGYDNVDNWLHESMFLLLPFETTVSNLLSLGRSDGLSFDVDAMRAAIKKSLAR